MKDIFATCRSVTEAVSEVERLISTTGDTDKSKIWRLKGVRRCLRTLQSDASLADRGAAVRQLTRLMDGHALLPMSGTGLSPHDLSQLGRFGLQAHVVSEDSFNVMVVDDEPLPSALADALRLDPLPRRPFQPEIGDGALRRLAPFSDYQTATQKSGMWALLTMPPASTLAVTMPTGSGKSLLFQIGTLWWRETDAGACAVVIVPTIALAHDHERTLRSIPGLSACRALTSEITYSEQREALVQFNRGEVPILLLSPEMALGSARSALLTAARAQDKKPIAAKGRLVALFIDEAHIVEAWGRSFRPDFQRLPALVEELGRENPDFRVVLLSATVGDRARAELRRAYGQGRSMLEIDARLPRYEFDLLSLPQESGFKRDQLVVRSLDCIPRPCIVYTNTVKHAEDLYRELRDQRGYKRIELFTGQVSGPGVRQDIIQKWNADLLDVVVATSAFGLGVDKADVRAIVHACIPESPARYYQEIGRAARDGFQGLALSIWTNAPPQRGIRNDIELTFYQATRGWLTIPLSVDRWWAMIDKSKAEDGLKSRSGVLSIEFSIDAVHRGLPADSDFNRLWNMTLINLLQRAKALTVALVQENGHGAKWSAEIHDHRILTRTTESDKLLEVMFALREEEKEQSVQDVKELVSILDGDSNDCMLAGLFRLVEADSPWVDECGRCTWCRSVHATPPTQVLPDGIGIHWKAPAAAQGNRVPSGISLIYPDEATWVGGPLQLVRRLAHAGIDQFVVSDGMGRKVLEELANHVGSMGLVLEARHFFAPRPWSLAHLPSAVFLLDGSQQDAMLFDMCKDWHANHLDIPLLFISLPGIKLRGRPLEQIASTSAPYPETMLDQWVQRKFTNGDTAS